ncbi:hypothetical protein AO263_11415 [Pseudomonas sp. NZIPFR-PS5]|nr:hypothetical protein AO263_11415 [Pseudomonas sp. NZIPFR-PS5]
MPTDIDIDEIIKALAHPVRRQILDWLKDPVATFPDQRHTIDGGVCAYGQWHFFKRNEDVIQAFLQQLTQRL